MLSNNNLKTYLEKGTITLLSILIISATIGMMVSAQSGQVIAKSHPSSSSSTTSVGSTTIGGTNATTSQGLVNIPVETN